MSVTGEVLTESHGDETHHTRKTHFRFRIVIDTVTLRTQAILFVVVCVAWDTLVGVHVFNVVHSAGLRFHRRRYRTP